MNLKGIVRRFTKSTGELPVRLDELGNVAISSVLPPYAQLVKAGVVFSADCYASTELAPITAPTPTSPEFALYNGNSQGGPCLVLLQVSCATISGIEGLGMAMFVGVTTGKQTTVPTDYSGAIKTNLNGGPFNSKAILCNNPTVVGGTPSYAVVACHGHDLGINSVGSGLVANTQGMFIARPGYMICLEIVGETGTSSKQSVNFVWAELELDIE